MGCHLGWYFTVGCPLRATEENIKRTSVPSKTIEEKNCNYILV
jgi:hypothetical protein